MSQDVVAGQPVQSWCPPLSGLVSLTRCASFSAAATHPKPLTCKDKFQNEPFFSHSLAVAVQYKEMPIHVSSTYVLEAFVLTDSSAVLSCFCAFLQQELLVTRVLSVRFCSLSFLSPRNLGLVIPPPISELGALRRLKLLRVASKQFAPLLLPPGFANLGATLTELVLECADWPAIPQVTLPACLLF